MIARMSPCAAATPISEGSPIPAFVMIEPAPTKTSANVPTNSAAARRHQSRSTSEEASPRPGRPASRGFPDGISSSPCAETLARAAGRRDERGCGPRDPEGRASAGLRGRWRARLARPRRRGEGRREHALGCAGRGRADPQPREPGGRGAGAIREAAQDMAQKMEEAARRRQEKLREEARTLEERRQEALEGLRDIAGHLEDVLAPS